MLENELTTCHKEGAFVMRIWLRGKIPFPKSSLRFKQKCCLFEEETDQIIQNL